MTSSLLRLSIAPLAVIFCASLAVGQISGATKGQPVVATSSTTATSEPLYIDAAQFANIQTAINSGCPPAGCLVDARDLSGALGSIDPGNKAVTLLLGPYEYTASNITLESGLKIRGAGALFTKITATGNAPLVTFPQGSSPNTVLHSEISDLQLIGEQGNTSDGILIDVSGQTGSTYEYSRMERLLITGFNGVALHLKGRPNDAASAIQFDYFNQVWASRPTGGTSPVLKVEGYNAQLTFETCEFDGASPNDGFDDIYLGPNGSAGTYGPLTIFFHNQTFQNGTNGFHFGGVANVEVDGGHTEATALPFLITADSSQMAGASNVNIVIRNTYVAGTSGSTGILNDTDGFSTVTLSDNLFWASNPVIVTTNNPKIMQSGNKYVSFSGELTVGQVTYSTLKTRNSPNGTMLYCVDCNSTCNGTTSSNPGRTCFREHGVWTH